MGLWFVLDSQVVLARDVILGYQLAGQGCQVVLLLLLLQKEDSCFHGRLEDSATVP